MRVTTRQISKKNPGLVYMLDWLNGFNLKKLERLSVSQSIRGVSGRCAYPAKRNQPGPKGYQLKCRVGTVYPYEIDVRKPPLYPNEDGRWPEVPEGCYSAGHSQRYSQGEITQWLQIRGHTTVENMSEAIVWIIAHEAYHFLRREKQLAGRNDEIRADAFADDMLAQFRTGRSGTPKRWR